MANSTGKGTVCGSPTFRVSGDEVEQGQGKVVSVVARTRREALPWRRPRRDLGGLVRWGLRRNGGTVEGHGWAAWCADRPKC